MATLSPEQQIAELRQALAERDAVIAAHKAEAAIVQAKLTTARLEIEHIKVQLASLRRQRYGQSSEKLDGNIAQLEMRLEDFEETIGEQEAAIPQPQESDTKPIAPPRCKPAGRRPLPAHSPREIVVHAAAEVAAWLDRPEIRTGLDRRGVGRVRYVSGARRREDYDVGS